MKQLIYVTTSLFACLSLIGCGAEPVNITEVLNHSQCNHLRTGLSQIEFADLARIRGTRLLTSPGAAPEPATGVGAELGVLLFAVSKGSQPTPGYRFELMGVQAQGTEVELRYAWLVPLEEAVLAQVVTSPCSVVQLPDQPQVSAVSAWLDGQELGRIELRSAS